MLRMRVCIRRDEQHAQIVDAEMVVDDARCDDLAICANFRFDDALDALGAGVGFDREVSIVDADERVGLDPPRGAGDRWDGDAKRLRKCLRALGRFVDDLDMIAEATA